MSQIDRFLAALQDHGCSVKRTPKGWMAQCPAHDDKKPSLSVAVSRDGAVLAKCHAGCAFESVTMAVGIPVPDLCGDTGQLIRSSADNTPGGGSRRGDSSAQECQRADIFESADQAVNALRRSLGVPSARWQYDDHDGVPLGLVVRWDDPVGGKTFRPVSRVAEGWAISAMPSPVLYRLPNLIAAETVFVCEGEKSADAANEVGLVATTSPGGACAARSADWSPLRGKTVVILPDNDDPGEKYADECSRLARDAGAPKVLVVQLTKAWPTLGEGGDLADVLELEADNLETVPKRIDDLVRRAERVQRAEQLRHETIPVHALPSPIREVAQQGADAITCDPGFLAGPLLVSAAAAIGNSSRIELKPGYLQPPVLWIVLVGKSGSGKSPAQKMAFEALSDAEAEFYEEFEADMTAFRRAKGAHKEELRSWKDGGCHGEEPVSPVEPTPRRAIVSDVTLEALCVLFKDNPRGLVMAVDELTAWIRRLDRYTVSQGGDLSYYLSMFDAASFTVDRKTTDSFRVTDGALSISGGVQPGVFKRLVDGENTENGLLARLLIVRPPRRPLRWSEAVVEPAINAKFRRVIDRLLELKPEADGTPVTYRLSPDAKSAWVEFADRFSEEQIELDEVLAASWAKLRAYAGRFALVIHLVDECARRPGSAPSRIVSLGAMRSAIELVQWFATQARLVVEEFREEPAEAAQRELCDWIRACGGSVSPRELYRAKQSKYRTVDAAKKALDNIVERRLAERKQISPGPKGGRPSVRYVLVE